MKGLSLFRGTGGYLAIRSFVATAKQPKRYSLAIIFGSFQRKYLPVLK